MVGRYKKQVFLEEKSNFTSLVANFKMPSNWKISVT
jgi:hypothetical protein